MGVLGKADELHPCWQSTRRSCGPSFLWKSQLTCTVVSRQEPRTRNLPPAPRGPGREFGHSLSIPKTVLLPTPAMELEQSGAFGSVGWCVDHLWCHGMGQEGPHRLELGGDLVIKTGMLGVTRWWEDATKHPGPRWPARSPASALAAPQHPPGTAWSCPCPQQWWGGEGRLHPTPASFGFCK